jgi:hypothetical protein
VLSQLSPYERVIIGLDRNPWAAWYRVCIGYLVPWSYFQIWSHTDSKMAVLWFICCLIALRLFPAILRKLLPFDVGVKAIWAHRRQIAKIYDSYQWSKLFWFGLGMASFALISKTWYGVIGAIAIFCILGGGFGIFIWQRNLATGRIVIDPE